MKKRIALLSVCLIAVMMMSACGSGNPTAVTDRMDVQTLWREVTGQDGYPQACLIVKDELARESGDFVAAFVAAVEESDGWAQLNPAEAVAAVKANMQQGVESSMTAVSADVVNRCHIKTIRAAEAKLSVETYLECFIDMEKETEQNLIGGKLPDDGFYLTPSGGANPSRSVKVYMPDGATALALAGAMANHKTVDGINIEYTVVPSNSIGSSVTSSAADIAVVPSNLAAKLYNANGKYKMAATLTHGNLYIVGGDMEGAQTLAGNVVGVMGQGNVPDLVFRYILKKKNIEYVVSDVAVEGKVAIKYYADGGSVARALKAGQIGYGLLAEPAASSVYDKIHE